MSSEHTFLPKAKFHSFSLHPLVTAASAVFADLIPLLGADSPINENLTEQVKTILEVFAKGVEFAFLSVNHTNIGVMNIINLLKQWDDISARLRSSEFKSLARRLLLAEANSIDCRETYEEARSNADLLFTQLLDTYGPDVVVELTSIGNYTDELNFEKSTIKNIGTRVISHLEQSKSSMTAFMEFLLELNKTLRDFLGDEQISLAQSPQDLPFWSANPLKTWEGIRFQLRDVDGMLNAAVLKNITWFKRVRKSAVDIIQSDLDDRVPKIILPDIKVQVPEPKATPEKLPPTWFPSDLVQTAMASDGDCVIHIANIEQSKPGTTTVKFTFVTRATRSWILRLQNLVVHLNVIPEETASPLQIFTYHPSSIKELRDDSHFQPKHCRPQLNIVASSTSTSSTVDWDFSRPIFRLTRGTVFPTNLSIELDVEHSVGFLVEVRLTFTYRRFFVWKVIESVRSGIYAPAESTTALTEPARP